MSTAFERGRKEGSWTRAQVKALGFHSPQACLEHAEQRYQQSLAEAQTLPEPHRQDQIDFLNGMIAETRVSLRRLL